MFLNLINSKVKTFGVTAIFAGLSFSLLILFIFLWVKEMNSNDELRDQLEDQKNEFNNKLNIINKKYEIALDEIESLKLNVIEAQTDCDQFIKKNNYLSTELINLKSIYIDNKSMCLSVDYTSENEDENDAAYSYDPFGINRMLNDLGMLKGEYNGDSNQGSGNVQTSSKLSSDAP